ncbi:MAG: DUF2089 domain-containing protein [Chloroflexi bacterium]|nr:DUF2089 domain-containing protein [Chloroflexota bacterium]MCI0575987.1 DUF2089 domain-containing protein [Chloroflexota bacterium]MCI0648231.1 DUF2089 domain-containing protein [Chloroflexota bacterium]MCI0725197.1 DUF2089 domain-containing protein [Chloroflexota bacterium]
MRKILEQCPTCGGELAVTQLSCTNCETVILGRYAPCLFCRLSPENLRFLEVFVKNRGNVKEMERELGVSYWAIRNRLNEVVAAMGFEAEPAAAREETSAARRDVLEQLNRGEITVAEAAELLKRTEG